MSKKGNEVKFNSICGSVKMYTKRFSFCQTDKQDKPPLQSLPIPLILTLNIKHNTWSLLDCPPYKEFLTFINLLIIIIINSFINFSSADHIS